MQNQAMTIDQRLQAVAAALMITLSTAHAAYLAPQWPLFQ
jgi:hypothetical protein